MTFDKLPPALKAFILDLRQHSMFPLLIKAMESPSIPRFRASQANDVERARAQWIYQSGKKDQHDAVIHFLTGEIPSGDSETSQQEKS